MKVRTSMAAYYILYNPHAGNGSSEATAKKLRESGKYEPSEVVSMTDIKSYSEFFADKADASVILCCGDGTLNRFINDADGVVDVKEYFDEHVKVANTHMAPYKKVGLVKIRKEEFIKNTSRKITRFNIDKSID